MSQQPSLTLRCVVCKSLSSLTPRCVGKNLRAVLPAAESDSALSSTAQSCLLSKELRENEIIRLIRQPTVPYLICKMKTLPVYQRLGEGQNIIRLRGKWVGFNYKLVQFISCQPKHSENKYQTIIFELEEKKCNCYDKERSFQKSSHKGTKIYIKYTEIAMKGWRFTETLIIHTEGINIYKYLHNNECIIIYE